VSLTLLAASSAVAQQAAETPPGWKTHIITPDLVGNYIGRWSSSHTGAAKGLYVTFTESGEGGGKGKFRIVADIRERAYNNDLDFTTTERGDQLILTTTDGSFTVTLSRVDDGFEGEISGRGRNFKIDYLKKNR